MDEQPVSPTVLTIAGFDPSSGAGITADLAVFAANACFGTSAITALTVQSTTGVRRVQAVPADLLQETLACLEEDLPPAGIKIGMLADAPQVAVVARYLESLHRSGRKSFVVLDPVLRASSGKELLTAAGLEVLMSDLLPLIDVVTPNTVELSQLTKLPCESDGEVEAALCKMAESLKGLSVLATGGHRETPDDVLRHRGFTTYLPGTFIATSATHGTGCAFSSALLCACVKGLPLIKAAAAAKAYVATAMRRAEPRGSGKGPLALLWPFSQQRTD